MQTTEGAYCKMFLSQNIWVWGVESQCCVITAFEFAISSQLKSGSLFPMWIWKSYLGHIDGN